jgi:Delta7-sterol 5-desaturase
MFLYHFPFITPVWLFFLSIVAIRFSLSFLGEYLQQTPYGERRKIYRIEVSRKQKHRENTQFAKALLVDGLFFFVITYYDILSVSFPESLFISVIEACILHYVVMEVAWYFLHRAYHTFPLMYDTFHHMHHESLIPQPCANFVHESLGRLFYLILFWGIMIVEGYFGILSFPAMYIIFVYHDAMGVFLHSNTELYPNFMRRIPFRLIWISPSYHALHHTRFHGNYGLTSPLMDYIFGTRFHDVGHVSDLAVDGVGLHKITERGSSAILG